MKNAPIDARACSACTAAGDIGAACAAETAISGTFSRDLLHLPNAHSDHGCNSLFSQRTLLYEGAQTVITRSVKWSWLKAWAMKIAKNRGLKRAIVASRPRKAANPIHSARLTFTNAAKSMSRAALGLSSTGCCELAVNSVTRCPT